MFKAGDKVWAVFDRGSNPQYLTIEKVGRKWITIDHPRQWRFVVGDRILEEVNFGRIGTIFASQEEWEAIVALNQAKKVFFDKFCLGFDSPLRNLSLAELEAIDQILEGTNAKH